MIPAEARSMADAEFSWKEALRGVAGLLEKMLERAHAAGVPPAKAQVNVSDLLVLVKRHRENPPMPFATPDVEALQAELDGWKKGVADANRIAQEHAARADRIEREVALVALVLPEVLGLVREAVGVLRVAMPDGSSARLNGAANTLERQIQRLRAIAAPSRSERTEDAMHFVRDRTQRAICDPPPEPYRATLVPAEVTCPKCRALLPARPAPQTTHERIPGFNESMLCPAPQTTPACGAVRECSDDDLIRDDPATGEQEDSPVGCIPCPSGRHWQLFSETVRCERAAPQTTPAPGLPTMDEVVPKIREILAKEGYVIAAMALAQAWERERPQAPAPEGTTRLVDNGRGQLVYAPTEQQAREADAAVRAALARAAPQTTPDREDERCRKCNRTMASERIQRTPCEKGGRCEPPWAAPQTTPAPDEAADAFHVHLDACARCREHPFDLCTDGARLLRTVGTKLGVVAPRLSTEGAAAPGKAET